MQEAKRNTGPNAPRRGRYSASGANYFVTICTQPRRSVLVDSTAAHALREMQTMASDAIWILRCGTVMPDHLHLFFTLGDRLTLPQTIARLKFRTRLHLGPGVRWQDNFYDHQLRPDDPVESVLRYIYLNPYQAGLLTPTSTWPHFHCHPDDWAWFKDLTDSGQPLPDWLQ